MPTLSVSNIVATIICLTPFAHVVVALRINEGASPPAIDFRLNAGDGRFAEERFLAQIEHNSRRKMEERATMLTDPRNPFSEKWAAYDGGQSADMWYFFAPYDICPWTLTKDPGFEAWYDGGKWVCGLSELAQASSHNPGRRCVVYSIGSRGNFYFEVAVKKAAPMCEVHVFDPTFDPRNIHIAKDLKNTSGLPESLIQDISDKALTLGPEPLVYDKYHMLAIGKADDACGFRAKDPWKKEKGCLPTSTISTIMSNLGHDHVDILKMDIDGGEWDNGKLIDMPFEQIGLLLMELHPNYGGPVTAGAMQKAIVPLEQHGMRMYSLEPTWDRTKPQVETAWRNYRWRPQQGPGTFVNP